MAVTVIGTGSLGTAVARALLGAGREVHVWNRTQGRAAALVAEGAQLQPSVVDAVQAAPLSLLCLTDHAAVQDVLDELPGGWGEPRATVAFLSTGSPEEVRQSAALAGSRGLACLGVGVQAAPGDIGTSQALLLYAGERATFELHQSDLDVLGPARWVGPTAAAAAELDLALFGLWYDAQLGLLRAFEMAERAGVPPAELADLAETRLRFVTNGATATAREVVERDYPRGPASLAEQVPVLSRLAESRREAHLGDGGLAHVAVLAEGLAAGPDAGHGLTALLDERSRPRPGTSRVG